VYAIVLEVRRLFHRLASASDTLHADVGVSAAQRAVLEALATSGASTVPELARRKGVSRQHVQVLANALAAARLIDARPNPAHLRSPLLELTEAGRQTFEAMRARETPLLVAVASALEGRPLDDVLAVLRELGDAVEDAARRHVPRRGREPRPRRGHRTARGRRRRNHDRGSD
jgi:DNA-binding MarR family transcriptional regulator